MLEATFVVHVVRPFSRNATREVDFVIDRRGQPPVAIECTRRAAEFEPRGMLSFRRACPEGANFVVSMDTRRGYERGFADGLVVRFVGVEELVRLVTAPTLRRRRRA